MTSFARSTSIVAALSLTLLVNVNCSGWGRPATIAEYRKHRVPAAAFFHLHSDLEVGDYAEWSYFDSKTPNIPKAGIVTQVSFASPDRAIVEVYSWSSDQVHPAFEPFVMAYEVSLIKPAGRVLRAWIAKEKGAKPTLLSVGEWEGTEKHAVRLITYGGSAVRGKVMYYRAPAPEYLHLQGALAGETAYYDHPVPSTESGSGVGLHGSVSGVTGTGTVNEMSGKVWLSAQVPFSGIVRFAEERGWTWELMGYGTDKSPMLSWPEDVTRGMRSYGQSHSGSSGSSLTQGERSTSPDAANSTAGASSESKPTSPKAADDDLERLMKNTK